MKAVFDKLDGMQRFCKIIVDEIHIKISIRYRGGHVIGNSLDERSKAARTVLSIMIGPLTGAPAFVADYCQYINSAQTFFTNTFRI